MNTDSSPRLDRDGAIANFMENVDHLTRLPFVTDLEIEELYGEEVAAALGDLERINQEKRICQQCDSNCCRDHGCEFYAPQFSQCPIHDLRPPICRFHFCEQFRIADRPTITELSEIFLYSLSVAAANGSGSVKFFKPPPFATVSPELIEIIKPLVNGVQSGNLKPGYGRRRVRQEVIKYTNAANTTNNSIEKRA
jgi:hypothetical protein